MRKYRSRSRQAPAESEFHESISMQNLKSRSSDEYLYQEEQQEQDALLEVARPTASRNLFSKIFKMITDRIFPTKSGKSRSFVLGSDLDLPPNIIRNQKFTVLSFVPMILFEQVDCTHLVQILF